MGKMAVGPARDEMMRCRREIAVIGHDTHDGSEGVGVRDAEGSEGKEGEHGRGWWEQEHVSDVKVDGVVVFVSRDMRSPTEEMKVERAVEGRETDSGAGAEVEVALVCV
jgi:hypothetical protein